LSVRVNPVSARLLDRKRGELIYVGESRFLICETSFGLSIRRRVVYLFNSSAMLIPAALSAGIRAHVLKTAVNSL
jgi:hypothetical protein